MLGVIYLQTIKNIYESVSAVCSKHGVINLPVYPHSPPLPLSVGLSPPHYLSLHLVFLSFLIFQLPYHASVCACAHKDLPSISNSSALIGFRGTAGGKGGVIWCYLFNTEVGHISKQMSLIQQFKQEQ